MQDPGQAEPEEEAEPEGSPPGLVLLGQLVNNINLTGPTGTSAPEEGVEPTRETERMGPRKITS